MAAGIPNSRRQIGGPKCNLLWLGAGISLEQAEDVRESVNSKGVMIIPDDFPLAGELTAALGDFRIRKEIEDTDLTMAELRKYLSELVKEIDRLEQVSGQMGEAAFGLLYEHGAFRSHQAGLGRHPISDAPANKAAIENALRSWRDAAATVQSQLEGARPKKAYTIDTAVTLLADVYEKGSQRTASAKDYEDTPFMRFASSALPLFRLTCPPGHVLRRILHERNEPHQRRGVLPAKKPINK